MKKSAMLQIALAMAAMGGDNLYNVIDDEAERAADKYKKRINPHNYPVFHYDDGFVLYAVNKESADTQYAKIMKKKNRRA